MNILVACEESQEVCMAFRAKGHEAYSCDLQECSGGHPEWHIKQDCLEILRGGYFITQDGEPHEVQKWDLLIAHPPCTFLTNGGAVRMFRKEKKIYPSYGEFQMVNVERVKNMIRARDFFLAFYNADCEKICIENPVPMSIATLPKCSQVIQPYEFGEPYSKKTYLWVKGLEPLKPTEIVQPICSWVSGGSKKNDGLPRKNKGMTFRDSERKSKTFRKIAEAMADQWGGVDETGEIQDI